jgi:Protein kinase domain
MLCFEDLLAARLVSREHPDRRDVLLAALDTLEEGDTARGLLSSLVACQVLTAEEGERVAARVVVYKRMRALKIYLHLAVARGLPRREVQELAVAASADTDPHSLGRLLVEAGHLTPEQHEGLAFRARLVSDRDLARQVEDYRRSRLGAAAAHQAPAAEAPDEPRDSSISQVVKLPRIPGDSGRQILPDGDTSRFLATERLADPAESGGELRRPPGFPIPEWVDTADALVGTYIADYRVLGRVGAGAVGVVYLADHSEQPTRPVALKLLRDEASGLARGRFQREILAGSFFSHPGVVEVYDAGETTEGQPYLAMELFEGEELAHVLEAEGRLEPIRALRLTMQAFTALAAAHEAGVVHGDVKPGNILVSLDGRRTKLMDFGLATLHGLGDLEARVYQTQDGTLAGTPMYMSPEQAAGRTALHPPSDVYSMALVLYEALAGRLPFEADSTWGYVSAHADEEPLPLIEAAPHTRTLHEGLHHLLDDMLSKDPAQRPGAAIAATVIDRALDHLQSHSSGRWFLGRWGKRRR